MKLVASAIVRNELGRYLEPWIGHLREFCDELVLVDDASTDDTAAIAKAWGATVFRSSEPRFDEHEGRARQQLLEFTLAREPTHVLAIDADEFVVDGPRLRRELAGEHKAKRWMLSMSEVWELDGDCVCLRSDGHWRPYKATVAWKVPDDPSLLVMPDRQLACGRLPAGLNGNAKVVPIDLLHFGWANESERQARYDRYMRIDGGRFHNLAHLKSILGPWTLQGTPWPSTLAQYREELERRVFAVR